MENSKNVIDILIERGYIAQTTGLDEIKELFAKPGVRYYIGFDPTADSLHVGHFIQMMVMSHLQQAGHFPVALLGGGTGMIGDPSGRSDMRQMLSEEDIQHNIDRFAEQMTILLDLSEGNGLMVNNAEWLMGLKYIEYLREIGPHFSVNRMLTADAYKTRYEQGLTFLEFNYMTIQAYDFYRLYIDHNVQVQLGGNDQWSNILAGTELIRRKTANHDAYGVTTNLLVKSNGEKMGKTSSGALWLDPEKTSPFEFYQYWRNIDDSDVITCMKLLTFLPLEVIDEYAKLEGEAINEAKKVLALEVTKIVHGEGNAKEAEQQALDIFAGAGRSDDMPTSTYTQAELNAGLPLLQTMTDVGLTQSNSEARRLVQQGGVRVNDNQVKDVHYNLTVDDLENDEIIIRRGKKNLHRIVVD